MESMPMETHFDIKLPHSKDLSNEILYRGRGIETIFESMISPQNALTVLRGVRCILKIGVSRHRVVDVPKKIYPQRQNEDMDTP